MSMPSPYDVVNCEHFTAGAVGPPGGRVFYLQAAGDGQLVTLRCEKQQVAALAESLDRVLTDLPERPGGPVPNAAELREPVSAAWVVGGLGLGYDEDHDRLILLIEELVEEPDEDAAPPAQSTARWIVTRELVRAFVEGAETLMAGGRPQCPLCGRPMDPDGHTCIKTNGHRPH